MKNFLFILLAGVISLNLNAQNRDSLKNDTVNKKVIVNDNWSTSRTPKKKDASSEYRPSVNSDTTQVKIMNKEVVKVVEGEKGTQVKVGRRGKFAFDDSQDTTRIRIGRKRINIVDGWHGTRVHIDRVDRWNSDSDDFFSERESRFRGHWAGFDIGINGFSDEDYSAYGGKDFMELDMLKSVAVNINFLQYDISLQKERNTIGLVTGMGLEWNNYRFDKKNTIVEGENGVIEEVILPNEWSVKKSKLTNLYLTVPLLMEFQIPVRYNSRRIHISAGVVGGLRVASHTKIKYKDNGNTHKDKDHDDFNQKALRYSAHMRLGYKSINLFATYGLTDLFENNKGPKLTPYTVGITLVNF